MIDDKEKARRLENRLKFLEKLKATVKPLMPNTNDIDKEIDKTKQRKAAPNN